MALGYNDTLERILQHLRQKELMCRFSELTLDSQRATAHAMGKVTAYDYSISLILAYYPEIDFRTIHELAVEECERGISKYHMKEWDQIKREYSGGQYFGID